MSTADLITRLRKAKDDIRAAILAKGVEPGAGFESFAANVEAIPTGGVEEFVLWENEYPNQSMPSPANFAVDVSNIRYYKYIRVYYAETSSFNSPVNSMTFAVRDPVEVYEGYLYLGGNVNVTAENGTNYSRSLRVEHPNPEQDCYFSFTTTGDQSKIIPLKIVGIEPRW